MKKILLIILAISFYPFGCEAQIGCQDLEIESEKWNIEKNAFTKEIEVLHEANAGLDALVDKVNAQITTLKSDKTKLGTTIASKDVEIKSLEDQLASSGGEPEYITVNGVQYKVSDIQLIKPFQVIDTVTVTHCGATKDTDWFHHGGVDLPYPKDITFATAEYGMTRVKFNVKLTDAIKVQTSYKLKRIRDYEKAQTFYEFIE